MAPEDDGTRPAALSGLPETESVVFVEEYKLSMAYSGNTNIPCKYVMSCHVLFFFFFTFHHCHPDKNYAQQKL